MTNHLPPLEVWRMRTELDAAAVREPTWPDGVQVRAFALADAEVLHSLLQDSYQRGGGTVAPFEIWLAQMTTDDEFDPQLWFLAESRGTLVGAILCWTGGFVKDLVVRESWRRRGLGDALLRHAFKILAARGVGAVELKVEATNASAVRLYERLGMRVVERLESG